MTVIARKARDEYSSKFVQLGIDVLDTSDCYVQQHEAADCDINRIMDRYVRDGVIEHVRDYGGQYGDFTNVPDYATCLNMVAEAEDCFAALPAKIRAKFENDPGQFLEFVSDPSNRDEMALMGLLEPSGGAVSPVVNEANAEAEPVKGGAGTVST